MEIVFTAVGDAIRGHGLALRGETYLWMLPIYGAGGILLERVHRRLAPHVPREVRAFAYVGAMYAVEFGSGWLLCRALGKCPWDYGDRGLNVHGLIRLDFLPFWYGLGLAFEPVQARIDGALARRVRAAEE